MHLFLRAVSDLLDWLVPPPGGPQAVIDAKFEEIASLFD